MYVCAQINPNGLCFSVSRLKGPIEGDGIVPLQDYDDRLLGKKYDGFKFYGLTSEVDKQEIAVGEVVNITVQWKDLQGSLVDESEEVTATVEGQEELVTMQNGQGSFEFSADSPGEYRIVIRSASGCRTIERVKVV